MSARTIGAAAVIAAKERREGEGGGPMPRAESFRKETIADAQVLAAMPRIQVDDFWRLPGEQASRSADRPAYAGRFRISFNTSPLQSGAGGRPLPPRVAIGLMPRPFSQVASERKEKPPDAYCFTPTAPRALHIGRQGNGEPI
jgi:hypothetical protein